MVSHKSKTVLSLFPGLDILGRGFELEGFAVVKGPDIMLGGDIRRFNPSALAGVFEGIIGGPPCQAWSRANQSVTDHERAEALELIGEYLRIVTLLRPAWYLIENVPTVPDAIAEGYRVQRLDVTDQEAGGSQLRRRHIQFGSLVGHIIRPEREGSIAEAMPAVTSSNYTIEEQARLQGAEVPRLPYFSHQGRRKALANAVPLTMARMLARAVARRSAEIPGDCPCGCGRTVTGRQRSATVACRKRLSRARHTFPGRISKKDFASASDTISA